jgi:energy-converting hydrogenase Eha subunit A
VYGCVSIVCSTLVFADVFASVLVLSTISPHMPYVSWYRSRALSSPILCACVTVSFRAQLASFVLAATAFVNKPLTPHPMLLHFVNSRENVKPVPHHLFRSSTPPNTGSCNCIVPRGFSSIGFQTQFNLTPRPKKFHIVVVAKVRIGYQDQVGCLQKGTANDRQL